MGPCRYRHSVDGPCQCKCTVYASVCSTALDVDAKFIGVCVCVSMYNGWCTSMEHIYAWWMELCVMAGRRCVSVYSEWIADISQVTVYIACCAWRCISCVRDMYHGLMVHVGVYGHCPYIVPYTYTIVCVCIHMYTYRLYIYTIIYMECRLALIRHFPPRMPVHSRSGTRRFQFPPGSFADTV
jgi:hypothetical protein